MTAAAGLSSRIPRDDTLVVVVGDNGYFQADRGLADKWYAYEESQGVIRRDWKYIEWPEFDYVQLFDMSRDPGELRNLAGEPAYAARQAAFRQQLDAWRQRAR